MTTPSTRRTPIKTPKHGHNGARALEGRIEVGPLIRHAEKATGILGGALLLAEREVFLDGEPVGVVRQEQRRGYRIDRGGQRQTGPGLPTYWCFFDSSGRDYREADNRALAHCLLEALTLMTGGSL